MRPFEDNAITIVPEDLPLTAMVESDRLIVRPYSHGVVSTVVSVSGSDSGIFVLRLSARELVPAGAEVELGGRTFPVGTQGLAQLPIGQEVAEGSVRWPGGRCRVRLPSRVVAVASNPLELDCKRLQ